MRKEDLQTKHKLLPRNNDFHKCLGLIKVKKPLNPNKAAFFIVYKIKNNVAIQKF